MKENLLSLRCVIKSAYTLWSKVLMPIIAVPLPVFRHKMPKCRLKCVAATSIGRHLGNGYVGES